MSPNKPRDNWITLIIFPINLHDNIEILNKELNMEKQNFTAKYSPTTNRVRIHANSTEFYPKYLKYLFEYLKIPQNATIVFNDKKIKGGIEELIKEETLL